MKEEDFVSTLDMLDIDEDIIDNKLFFILNKQTQTSKQLKTAVILIKYKILLNEKEATDCDNEDIVQKILSHILNLPNVQHENFTTLLEALKVSLALNENNLKKLSEHFLQQLLSSSEILESNSEKPVLYLNIINSILNVCIQNKIYISSQFLLGDVNFIIQKSENTPLLLSIVPKIIAVSGEPYILNCIWDYIISKPFNNHDFTILSTLSDYYFNTEQSRKLNMLTTLTTSLEFWLLIHHGFTNDSIFVRKCSIYLAKRAVQSMMENNYNTIVNLNDDLNPLVHCNPENKELFENDWKNLFALLEILEEKQYRLVQPAMQLFLQIKSLHEFWLSCALMRALNHDIESIKSLAVEITLSLNLSWKHFPVEILLNALNNVFIYENIPINTLIENMKAFMTQNSNFNLKRIVKCMKTINWSPIPKFYVTFSMYSMENATLNMEISKITEALCTETSKMNNSCIQNATEICLINFIIKNASKNFKTNKLLLLIDKFKHVIIQNSSTLVEWIKKNNEKIDSNELLTLCNLKNYESLAKYFFLLKDAALISEIDFGKLINNSFEILQQSFSREYAEKEEFILWFLFIVSIIEDIDYSDFREVIKRNAEILLAFIKYHFDYFTNIEYEMINKIADKLQTILNLEWFLENIGHKIFAFCDEIIAYYSTSNKKNYICVKILSAIPFPVNPALNNMIFKNTFFKWDQNLNGKINCDYYEALGKLYNNYLKHHSEFNASEIDILFSAVENFLEIGGYNCIMYTIELFKQIHPQLLKDKKFDCKKMYELLWKNIFDIRKSDQFKKCIKTFISLLFVSDNKILMKYISELFVLGEQSPNVILELVHFVSCHEVNEKYVNLILAKALLFGDILRKDQRVENQVCHFIQQQEIFPRGNFVPFISTKIRKIALNYTENSESTSKEVAKQVKEFLQESKIKARYHDNTTQHKFILRSMQLLLLDQKFHLNEKNNADVKWFVELLKNPHSTSVKILIEWYIILHLIRECHELEKSIIAYNMFSLPQISLFTIIYHVVKYQISRKKSTDGDKLIAKENFIFALMLFSSNTMGSLFNVRLYSQYLMIQLLNITDNPEVSKKYALMKNVVQKTLSQMADEKNLKKLENDFYINKFDPIHNLNVENLYFSLPKLYDVSKDEWIYFALDNSNLELHNTESKKINISIVDSQLVNVQKKFLPLKPLLPGLQSPDKDVDESGKLLAAKKLIVVASLIDKLPNLGGLSRTCEIFGVKQYVISSLRHIQDKQFQSVSVSAENWLDMIEIQPGNSLKEYLIEMKSQGYCIIGAEQTSSSSSLYQFKFPEKSLILLGHEKEGVPCDLINLMDYCVEVPQYGMIRSLNVHVTASIFIWEYQKQHRSLLQHNVNQQSSQ